MAKTDLTNQRQVFVEEYVRSVAGPLVPEWSERFELKYTMVFGNVKKDVIELLSPFGATFHTFAGGFNHR